MLQVALVKVLLQPHGLMAAPLAGTSARKGSMMVVGVTAGRAQFSIDRVTDVLGD